jgi:hypothetical protein
MLLGGSGDDQIWGNQGNDLIDGEAGNDRLFGDSGDDIVLGSAGNDSLDGGSGKDKLEGGAGTDTLKSDKSDLVVEQDTKAGQLGLKAYFSAFAAQFSQDGVTYTDPANGSATADDRPAGAWIASYRGSLPGSQALMHAADASDANDSDAPRLDDVALAPIVDAAIERWTSVLGADDPRLAALSDLHVQLADLPGAELGDALGHTVTIDLDAAGHGWFIDLTPRDSSEFTVTAEASTLTAAPGSGAQARMDLVTVLTHEIGHVLGFDHGDAGRYAVMHEDLDPGVRYLVDELGYDADPDHPVTDHDLVKLAAQAARHEEAKQSLGQPAFDWNYGPVAGARGSVDWTSGSASSSDPAGWDSGYSPYSPAKPDKAAKNFSDFLVKGFDSLGSSLFGAKAKDKR